MKRYIEVSKHTGGRTITQRYPAREVGEVHYATFGSVFTGANVVFGTNEDRKCRACGFHICSKTGPCAPKPVEPAPPADVLPAFKVGDRVRALVGYSVTRADVEVGELGTISAVFSGDYAVRFDGPATCTWSFVAEWMALASVQTPCVRCGREATADLCSDCARVIVQPAEPVLRPGWKVVGEMHGHPQYGLGSQIVYFSYTGAWRAFGDRSDHSTLEAACLRAEELAGAS